MSRKGEEKGTVPFLVATSLSLSRKKGTVPFFPPFFPGYILAVTSFARGGESYSSFQVEFMRKKSFPKSSLQAIYVQINLIKLISREERWPGHEDISY